MNIKQSLVLFSSIFFSFSALSASKWSGDWFEVEVILISHLDDKAKLKEKFSRQNFTLDYKNALDLLSPYLNPNIASLKQKLPMCGDELDERTYLEKASIWPVFFPNKTLESLDAEQAQAQVLSLIENEGYITNSVQNSLEDSSEVNSGTIPVQPGDNDDFFDRIKTKQEQRNINSITSTDTNHNEETTTELASDIDIFDENSVAIQAINDEQISLVLEAEKTFSDIQFNYQSLYADTETQTLCHISQTQFDQLNPDKNLYMYNGFVVNQMPKVINNSENLYSKFPYLLSKNSLQLSDIVKQLRRSKNFRPLLHLAWRQPVFEKKESQALKLFAGDNLQAKFERSMSVYQSEKSAALLEEQTLNEIFQSPFTDKIHNKNSLEKSAELTKENQLEELKKQRINGILQELPQVNNIETVIKDYSDTPVTFSPLSNDLIIKGPLQPVQPWYIEGLIDVYLIGNFLNVAADFSILNFSLTDQESLLLKPNNKTEIFPIRLTQNRRMISREVHYFDHPYMGIIVQIRRHKQPELPSEETKDFEVAEN